MSFFNNIFGSSENQNDSESNINWTNLTEISQLDEIITASKEQPVIIFKHSTRCSISRMALKQFEKEYDFTDKQVTPYFLDLLAHRPISNDIAARFGVMHQSPQLLLIKDEKSIYDASHSDIDAEDLKRFVNQ